MMAQNNSQPVYPRKVLFEDLLLEHQQAFTGGDADREGRIKYLKKAVTPLINLKDHTDTYPNPEFINLIDKAVGSSSYASFTRKAGIDQGNFSKVRREKIDPSITILLRLAFFADPKSGVTFEQLLNNAGYVFKSSDHSIVLQEPYHEPYYEMESDLAIIRARLIDAIAGSESVKRVTEDEMGETADDYYDFVLKTDSFPNGWAFHLLDFDIYTAVNECLIRSISGNYDKISIVVSTKTEYDSIQSSRKDITNHFNVSVILCTSTLIEEAVLGPNKHLLRL